MIVLSLPEVQVVLLLLMAIFSIHLKELICNEILLIKTIKIQAQRILVLLFVLMLFS